MKNATQKTAAIFSCQGLGDGLIALVLANNLTLNGYKTTTFHPSLEGLQEWFPTLSIAKRPQTLEPFDRLFFFVENTPHMQALLNTALENYRDKTVVLNPIATKNCDYPYWEEGQFDGTRSFVDNLYTFSQSILRFPVCTKTNAISPPASAEHKRYPKRVVIHPTSSREGKNWPQHKFLQLAKELKKEGLDPLFLLHDKERLSWDLSQIQAPEISSLFDLATLIYESGFLIGNDSGPGHLASCLRIPTLSLFRHHNIARFWRPGWDVNEVICPPKWLLNIKGLRLRDKFWKHSISVERVKARFLELCKLGN